MSAAAPPHHAFSPESVQPAQAHWYGQALDFGLKLLAAEPACMLWRVASWHALARQALVCFALYAMQGVQGILADYP